MSKRTLPTWGQVIIDVLKEKGGPMRYNEIAQIIVDKELRGDKIGATPAITVNSYLRNRLKEQVKSLGHGVYCLVELATANAAEIAISESLESGDDPDIQDDLITSYGRFWDRNLYIENSCELFGRNLGQPKAQPVNFSKFEGIYLLHKGYQVVYVGQSKELTKRLYEHTIDDKRNRWDNFSWFSIRDIENDDADEIKKSIDGASILDTLEALLIETIGPERNRKLGNSFADKEFEQIKSVDYYKNKK